MSINSTDYFNNRKKNFNEQFNYWKFNFGSGCLRLIERVFFGFNVSDMLAGNLGQVIHLQEVKNQVTERRFLENSQMQVLKGSELISRNSEASPPQYSFVIRDARVDVLTGVILLNSGFILDSTLAKWQKLLFRGGISSAVKRSKRAKAKIAGTHMVLPHSPYYYHTLIDELPNLIKMRETYSDCNSVIVHDIMPKWGLELLSYFNFETYITSEKALIVENLITLTAPRAILKNNLNYLRVNLHQNPTDIVIVTRNGTPRSDALIEKALLEQIPRAILIDPAEISVTQQVEVFSKAKVIIGLHGGALSNVIWMDTSGVLIEIFNHAYRTSDYERLCAELGISYLNVNGVHHDSRHVASEVRTILDGR